jgi:perosamine synthetase
LANDSSKPFLGTRPTLPLSVLLGRSTRGRLPTPLDAGGVTFHVKARNGIWQLIQALGLGESEIVLVPSYNCGAELDAVLRAPAAVRFYRVGRSAQIDVDDLRQAIEPRTRGVIVTHYFGFPQPDLRAIVELCRDHSLVLIEDCAHALYSTHLGRPLGTFGDAGIFSLWKTLPLPNGGAVLANRPLPLQGGTATPPLAASFTALRFGLEAHLRFRFGLAGEVVSALADRLVRLGAGAGKYVWQHTAASPLELESSLNPHVTFDRSTADWSMSPASRRIARRSPHVEIAQRRRRNYAFLAEELDGLSGARPLHPTLPSGACPLALPLVVDEPPSLLRQLESNGIGAELFWSDFHPAFPAHEFPESTYLKTHVVTLPIHQDLDSDLVARVAEVVRRWSRRR